MISTDDEFAEEAMVFFNKHGKYSSAEFSFDIESDAYNYVRKSNNFKY